jgi:hypothetical protein
MTDARREALRRIYQMAQDAKPPPTPEEIYRQLGLSPPEETPKEKK